MTFTPVKVIDITMQTDHRCYGGHMAAGDPSGIVLHHDGAGPGGEQGSIDWLSHYHANPVSTNQYVKRDGTIIQIVHNDVIAYHAGYSLLNGRSGCNNWCIGIEIANRGDGKEKYADAEYESVSQTVAYNAARYHIPDQDISSHARVATNPIGRKTDPINWDWLRMWDRIDQLLRDWPFAIQLWHGDGHRILTTK